MFQTEIFFSGWETKGNRYYYFISCINKNLLPSFFAFCLKNPCSPFALALRLTTIYRTETQTNKFLNINFVCLFAIKMSSLSDFFHGGNKNGRSQTNIANESLWRHWYAVLYFNFQMNIVLRGYVLFLTLCGFLRQKENPLSHHTSKNHDRLQ